MELSNTYIYEFNKTIYYEDNRTVMNLIKIISVVGILTALSIIIYTIINSNKKGHENIVKYGIKVEGKIVKYIKLWPITLLKKDELK